MQTERDGNNCCRRAYNKAYFKDRVLLIKTLRPDNSHEKVKDLVMVLMIRDRSGSVSPVSQASKVRINLISFRSARDGSVTTEQSAWKSISESKERSQLLLRRSAKRGRVKSVSKTKLQNSVDKSSSNVEKSVADFFFVFFFLLSLLLLVVASSLSSLFVEREQTSSCLY